MSIRLVPAREALRDWDMYEERLNRVIERADSPHTSEDILTCVQLGTMQLWRAIDGDGVGVTEVQVFPRYRQLLVYMVAGEDARDWLTGADKQLEAFALSQNCTRMEFHGRPGWAKWCQAFGYEHSSIRMKKEIGHGRRRTKPEQHKQN